MLETDGVWIEMKLNHMGDWSCQYLCDILKLGISFTYLKLIIMDSHFLTALLWYNWHTIKYTCLECKMWYNLLPPLLSSGNHWGLNVLEFYIIESYYV